MSRQLAEVLIKDRLITQAQLDALLASMKDKNADPVREMIKSRMISENKLLEYLSRKYSMHSINLAKFEIDKKVISLISVDLVRDLQIIPIQAKDTSLVVAVSDPTRLANVDKIRFVTKLSIEAVLTTYSAFDDSMAKYFSSSAVISTAVSALQAGDKKEDGAQKSTSLENFEVHDIDQSQDSRIDSSGEAVIAFVNGILAEGIRRNASDIHVEPYEKRFRVRMRIDGSMLEIAEVPLEMKRAVVARLKIMSRMDISESRIPQDGRIKLKSGGREIDFRVNSLPTLFGEKVVMRMLASGNLSLDLGKLGFEPRQLEVFKKGIYAPNGLVLVTGPTGSGKTTTLYSALAELNTITDNISTAEDPVEYNLEGINQTQVNKDVGLTFASVLRALLRQDPDTILVGEIRDYETAEVSIQAALTGHLVLSTLHTNDAPSSITRLMNMGVEPFLVTSSVNTIIAQRLLRRVCPKCKMPVTMSKDEVARVGFAPEDLQKLTLMKGRGCTMCNNSGYKGRVAIYEVFDFTTELKEMVLRGESIIDIRKRAVMSGMKSLRQSALSRAAEGATTVEEALGATVEE
ncbi:MAG: type IV-A pilus assembly ATPase PilB [Bdellovibrionales bacterium]|nr:type IV-A pilus assembly ATPase PilB [Bdellovibrionales bacterium]